jgi:CubicO group peptidase (beta-lactamase class C family)
MTTYSQETVQGAVAERLHSYLERITPFGFSGALLVALKGEILLNQGYGFAHRAAEIPNTSETVFSLGSITKQFTAAAIMKLETMGMLHTQDPITRYLASVPPDKEQITLHHLLTHTAGLINYTNDDYEMSTLEEALDVMLTAPLLFSPGERYEYSNAGYTLLAAVVEIVSEQAYETFLQRQLFEPAGMSLTGYRLPDWQRRSVAHWYVDEQDNGAPLEKPYPSANVLGNGEMLSTTLDMYRWHQALRGDAVLPEQAKEKLYQPFLNQYAYGWKVEQTPQGTLVEHGGASSLGSSAHFARYLDQDLVFILYCNEMNGGSIPMLIVREKIKEILLGGQVELPPALTTAAQDTTANLEGEHELRDGGRIMARRVHRRLHVVPLDEQATEALFGISRRQQQTLRQLTYDVLSAALEGDYGPLESVLADRESRLPRVKRLIERSLEAAKKESLELIGPAPSAFSPGAFDVAVTTANSSDEDMLVFIWREQQNIGCLRWGGDLRHQMMVPCVPISANEWLGYQVGLEQTVHVHIDHSY